MAPRTLLFTGFPGFIGRRLLARLLEDDPEARAVCLVQAKFLDQAHAEAARLGPRVACETGDIADPRLGLAEPTYADLAGRVTEVWHLAAVYDLAVAADLAQRVNVEGTRHVLDLCRAAKSLTRLVYFSTCYVAGDRTGPVREDELVMGQGFKNFYESTKFAAEVLVREEMAKGLPAIIVRPAIVVGDTRTGETDKFDGPYFGMQMVHTLRWLPGGLPRLGPSDAEVNIVPVDFLLDATVALARKPEALGLTFQVADPTPMKASDIYDRICRLVSGKPPAPYAIPPVLLEKTLAIPALKRWLGAPKEVLPFFNHKVKFDTANTMRLLQGTGVAIPRFDEYLPKLVEYWQAHRGEPGRGAKV